MNSPDPVTGAPIPGAPAQVASAALLTKVEALITKVDAKIKADEAAAVTGIKGFFSKHWPWMTGVAVAVAQHVLHL